MFSFFDFLVDAEYNRVKDDERIALDLPAVDLVRNEDAGTDHREIFRTNISVKIEKRDFMKERWNQWKEWWQDVYCQVNSSASGSL